MKRIFILIIISLTLNICNTSAYNDSVKSVLEELDKVLNDRELYHKQHEEKILNLKNKLSPQNENEYNFNICDEIFRQYLHYQADSALFYANKKWEYTNPNDKRQKDIIHLNKAESFAVMGMYTESYEQLTDIEEGQLDKELKKLYYFDMRTYFGWIAEYTPNQEEKKKYIEKANIYRDSTLMLFKNPIDIAINQAEKYVIENKADSAINSLLKIENYEGINLRQLASLYYTIYTAYVLKGDKQNQIYFLAKAAIADIKAPVREYASLQRLAVLVFDEGDIEKGYKYLVTSMEDAVACNARLRYIEVTELYPAIHKAYKMQEESRQRTIKTMLLVVCILLILLSVTIFYLFNWMKKLSSTRKKLSEANGNLVHVNNELKETGKIKEIYIMRYLEKCVNYLEKLEQYRRSLEKLAMASKTEELYKTIRSEQFIRDEKKNFYVEFDKSFLAIFPNFVNDFNNLLKEEEQIQLKPGELMNTEIRIFALIRLGVTDATNIAHFLGCSLATVYNYRSKIRNKAKKETDSFEQAVMEL